jgi:transposase
VAQARTLVGLDVHARRIVAATLDAETGELRSFRLPGWPVGAASLCSELPAPVRAVYEAGPTGYGLARELAARGIECVVAAPGKIPRAAAERVKTDRRDAERLARLLLAGTLCPVRVPGEREEALRDLVRAREVVRVDLMRARHRLSKLLLRHGLRYEGGGWTERHRARLAGVELHEEAAEAALCDYRGAVEALLHRRAELERLIAAAVPGSPCERDVARLRCLRGIDTLSAVGLCAEIGDFARFAGAGRLMSYVGLVPSEHSSGERRRQGPITKTGSRHARRLLAAWNYRYRPRLGRALEQRQRGQPPAAIAISWSAQRRLNRTWTRLRAKGKRAPIVTVAVARELAGFCWAITTIEEDEH